MTDHVEQFARLSGDLFLVAGRDGYLREAIGAWTDRLAWQGDELREKPLLELVHVDDRRLVTQCLGDVAAGAPVGELHCRLRMLSGAFRWMSISAAYDAEASCFYVVGKDIHVQRAREDFSNLLFEEASVGLNLCTMDGTWVLVSRR